MNNADQIAVNTIGLEDTEEIQHIREAVRALCARYLREYWCALDRERQYPTEFVRVLTEAGFLGHSFPNNTVAAGWG